MSSPSNGRFGSSAMARNFGNAAPAKADGQWHSFGARGNSAGPAMARQSGNAPRLVAAAHRPGTAGTGWHSFGNPGNVSAANSHTPASNVAMNRPSAMNPGGMRGTPAGSFGRSATTAGSRGMIPFSSPHVSSNAANFRFDHIGLGNSAFGRSSFGSSRFSSTVFGSSGLANSRFRNVSLFGGSRFGSTLGVHPGSNFFRSRGFGFGGFGGSRFGCFRCGFGRGFGWGWGLGFGGWWIPWWEPWWDVGWWGPGWGWGGYWSPYWSAYPWWRWPAPYYAYPPPSLPPAGYGVYDDNNSGSSDPVSSSNPAPAVNSSSADQNAPAGSSTDADQSAPPSQGSPNTNPVTGNVAESTPTVLLYLKDGTMYAASDYWVADNQLHYVVNYGGESVVDFDQVDLQRTVDENAKRGTAFILKAKPNRPAPNTSTDQTQASSATSASSSPQQNNGNDVAPAAAPTPGPEVKTTSQTQTQPQN